ncbi:MAG: sigma-70 family RNA polymerase sigma factor [Verrucomicrobiota bacterium]
MNHLETILLHNLDQFTAFVRRRISEPELAADIVQDSLLKALRSGDQLLEDENIIAWFYKILRHAIIDVYRRRAVNQRAIEKLKVDLESDEEIKSEICRCLDGIIPTLKPEYAELIRKVDLAENSPAQVAKELGITTNNLTVRLHRARAQLRERLEQTCQMCSKHGCLNCTCDTP